MIAPLRCALRRLLDEDGGSQSVEFLLIAPLLFWSIFATYEFTAAFRARGMAYDATAVVADTLSRQTAPIDQADLQGLRIVAGIISDYGGGTAMRVTQVRCTSNCDDLYRRTLDVVFSRGVDMRELTDQDLATGSARALVPLLAEGDRIVLAQTRVVYEPAFQAVGLSAGEVETSQVLRMRFATQLCWESCNPT